MRKIVVHMQATLDNRIANAQGLFWEPFPWGDEEMAYINEQFRRADTFAAGRHVYEVVVPWWETVARGEVPDDVPDVSAVGREFAQILAGMTKLVFSRPPLPDPDRAVTCRPAAHPSSSGSPLRRPRTSPTQGGAPHVWLRAAR